MGIKFKPLSTITSRIPEWTEETKIAYFRDTHFRIQWNASFLGVEDNGYIVASFNAPIKNIKFGGRHFDEKWYFDKDIPLPAFLHWCELAMDRIGTVADLMRHRLNEVWMQSYGWEYQCEPAKKFKPKPQYGEAS